MTYRPYLGYCSWCAKPMLPVHKITHIYIGVEPNQIYLKTMHSLCVEEEWEANAGVREIFQKIMKDSFEAMGSYFDEALLRGSND